MELAAGLPFDRLTLHYQPQVAAHDLKVIALEALLRVRDPLPGLMGAEDVLALATTDADIAALDWWILEQACRDSCRWPGIRVAVNVSAHRFREEGFVEQTRRIAERVAADPSRLELEIVEGAYIDDFEMANANITALRAAGFHVAIDDFGTGYSSLTYLLKLPIDKLKIDKSFIDEVQSMPSAAIVQAIMALARALGLKVTAEGVESAEQMRFLKSVGCHYLQGWLFSPALDVASVDALLAAGGFLRLA
jgi:EAL domain-containing protein (putative c-di-GMP-specific phosphodiesterase class I)